MGRVSSKAVADAAEPADAADAAPVDADAVEAGFRRVKNELAEMTTNSSPEIEPVIVSLIRFFRCVHASL